MSPPQRENLSTHKESSGATRRIRADDLLIKNQLLNTRRIFVTAT